jgi:hypothetical protein
MSDEIINEIRTVMQFKDTDELIYIWQSNNHYEWTDEAFTVVREILLERLGELPAQNEPVYDKSSAIPEKKEFDQEIIDFPKGKIFEKLYTKISGEMDTEKFFNNRHNTMINIAIAANILAYIILAISILLAASNYLNNENLCELNGYGCLDHNLFLGLFGPGGFTVFHYLAQVLSALGNGLIYSVALWGISVGLKMIVETDLNYRETAQEENNDLK